MGVLQEFPRDLVIFTYKSATRSACKLFIFELVVVERTTTRGNRSSAPNIQVLVLTIMYCGALALLVK